MNVQQLDSITEGHERVLASFLAVRDALEASARLTVAASVAVLHPNARWIVLQESDQGDGLWIESAILDDGSEVDVDADDLDDWAASAASDIYRRDDLIDLGDGSIVGYFAMEVWPVIDLWSCVASA